MLALWLTRLGVRVRIVDKLAEPGTTSRALAVQARTLEFYQQLGFADRLVERGRKIAAINMWVAGRHVARGVLADIGAGISPFPYPLIYPQDEHERLLIEQLARHDVHVERLIELEGLEEIDGEVVSRLTRADGTALSCSSAFVAGCDGAHSSVRRALSIDFGGGTYEHLFYVADVDATGPAMNGDIHVAFDATDFLALFPLHDATRARFVGTVRDRAAGRGDSVAWDDVSQRVIEWMNISVSRVNWLSTYRVHHRVAERFRRGRAFLLGDAAHIHSPVGGQGMNTGIGDAVNLAWKLAAVLRGTAAPEILNTYEVERIAFARRLVATTDRAFTAATSSTPMPRFLRLQVVPRLFPLFFGSTAARRFAFRTISQTAIDYRQSWLSEGRAGSLRGGDRLPWVARAAAGSGDNFEPLKALCWQVHIYGRASAEVRDVCATRRLPLHMFEWTDQMRTVGLTRDGLYLVRPDGYVGFAAAEQSAAALASYLDGRHVVGGSEP